ncbi:hypothetical protein J2S43_000344 [Catenuloplanes nepalensis]|uniref:Uncharacterized protein n=1 Tax=Catenuloplanes nepalensis TaxID=587533 RepID=A0ABT9MK77_9ACTN|nr:hypothetical protein [Catenuloplanes nepalensis]
MNRVDPYVPAPRFTPFRCALPPWARRRQTVTRASGNADGRRIFTPAHLMGNLSLGSRGPRVKSPGPAQQSPRKGG